jgi:ribonuclease E
MLDSERNSHETDNNREATGQTAGAAPAPTVFNGPPEPPVPAVPAALFQPPQVLFQPPAPVAPPPASERDSGDREAGGRAEADADTARPARRTRSGAGSPGGEAADDQAGADAEGSRAGRRTRSRGRTTRVRDTAPDDDLFSTESADVAGAVAEADGTDSGATAVTGPDDGEGLSSRRRRRRNTRSRGRGEAAADDDVDGPGGVDDSESDDSAADADADADGEGDAAGEGGAAGRRRRRKRRRGAADGDVLSPDDPPDTVVHVREAHNPADDVRAIKGSTRLEAKKQRRREGRESGRRRPPVVTESEFLARRESVERTMVVRQRGDRTQIAVLEDGILVEHYVNRTTHASYVGNVYLGKVQNVLPSMEAAFVDIGKGRNAVLYAGEVNFDASGLEGQPKRIESALKPGQSVIVQVTKDPVGHKGARLTSQVSLPGRYLVYVPGASMTGISRKLPDTERTRLKAILKKVTPENAGVIVRTAAEGAAEAELDRDITRLAAQWESIEKKAKTATAPALLYGEPDLTVRVIRDVFNEDFSKLIVSGEDGWEIIDEYVRYVAPHLADRISRWDSPDNEDADDDVFAAYRIDEQLAKALDRKVWLPSGGSLVIDRTEAMTVVDVNTGKFTGQGGNLEETVTRNNLEAAEEIVRQLRLRDVGGIVVIDFIDMVLESNRELVLRRLLECLARDRTKHQVAEVTSLGLVQMTRKRVGAGLLEAFSQQCECCNGRGVIITLDAPAEPAHRASAGSTVHRPVPAPPGQAPGNGNGKGQGNGGGNARAGYGNGRRGNGRRDDDRNARDAYPDTAQDSTTQAGLEAGSAQAGATPGDNGAAGTDGNGSRPRRSTSAGTAFAAAVIVDDTPALVPVVTTVPQVSDPAPAAVTPVVTGDTAPVQPADPSAPPVRRTRAGSAVARVTVVTEPEPAPEPAPAAAPPAAAEFPVTEAAAMTADAPVAPVAAEFPATEATATTADASVPPTEPEPESQADAGIEPAIVAASVFAPAPADAPATEESAPAESALAESAPAEPVAAETAPADPEAIPSEPASVTDAPLVEEAPSAPEEFAPETAGTEPGVTADEAQEAPAEVTTVGHETAEAPEADAAAAEAEAATPETPDEPVAAVPQDEAGTAEGEAIPAQETRADAGGEPPAW